MFAILAILGAAVVTRQIYLHIVNHQNLKPRMRFCVGAGKKGQQASYDLAVLKTI